jgi:hypothetical protein
MAGVRRGATPTPTGDSPVKRKAKTGAKKSTTASNEGRESSVRPKKGADEKKTTIAAATATTGESRETHGTDEEVEDPDIKAKIQIQSVKWAYKESRYQLRSQGVSTKGGGELWFHSREELTLV